MNDDMNRCPSFERLLLAQERELPDDETRVVLEHVARCRTCHERLAQLDVYARASVALVDEDLEQLSVDDAYTRFLARQQGDGDPGRVDRSISTAVSLPRRGRVRWWLAAAALVGLSTLVWYPGIILHAEVWVGRMVGIVRQFWSEALPPPLPPPSASVARAERPTPAIPSGLLRPDADALQDAELQARWVLATTDIDWRQRVQVRATREQVYVEGAVASTDEQARVSSQLSAVPHVAATLQISPSDDTARLFPAPGLTQWLDRTYGNAPERRIFMREFIHRLVRIDGRLRTLRALSDRYADGAVSRASSTQQERFRRLVVWQFDALTTDLNEADRHIVLLVGASTQPCRFVPGLPTDWRTRVTTGLRHVTTFNANVRHLLTREDVRSPAQVAADVERAIGRDFRTVWTGLSCVATSPGRTGLKD